VKYLLFPSSLTLLPALTKLGVKPVFEDAEGIATIYEMPDPRPFFSTSTSCTVTSTDPAAASVTCPAGSHVLVRSELEMKGWRAFVNGKEVTIRTVDGVYQAISVPQGTSNVTFSYTPPHEKYALLAGLLAALFLLGSWLLGRFPDLVPRRRRPGKHAAHD